jgi:hypothetical protein
MRVSHSLSAGSGRAFNVGNEPTMPALHCAITKSGPLTIKSGEPITGSDKLSLSQAGTLFAYTGVPLAVESLQVVENLGRSEKGEQKAIACTKMR